MPTNLPENKIPHELGREIPQYGNEPRSADILPRPEIKTNLPQEGLGEEKLITRSPEKEAVTDLSNYNEAGLQGPLINETSEQIRNRLTELLNDKIHLNNTDSEMEDILNLAETPDA